MCDECAIEPSIKLNRLQLAEFLLQLEETPPDEYQGAPSIDRYLVRSAVDQFNENAQEVNARFLEGRIDRNQWEREMRKYLRNLHFTTYTIGRGGVDKLTSRDMIESRRLIDRQFMFLSDWINGIDTANPPSEAQMNARIGMYANNSVSTAEVANSVARGLPLLPAYPRDGSTQCFTNCKCKWRYAKREDGWNVFWVMGRAEHCANCVKRSRTWNPLRYRNGLLMNEQKLDVPELFR